MATLTMMTMMRKVRRRDERNDEFIMSWSVVVDESCT